jgi:hypothetical protein
MPVLDGSILSAKAEILPKLQPKLSVPDAEFMAAIDKDIDDITADLERRGVSIKNTPNQPSSAVPLPAEDDLDRLLKELNGKS